MFFPEFRGRRLRRNDTIRRMVRETHLRVDDLIYPMFSAFGENIKKEIVSMPGIYQQSIENIVIEAKEVHALGIPAVLLFGIPEHKDAVGQDAYSETGIIQETIRAIKAAVPGLTVITDVCMCEYTDHGHCGVLNGEIVDNDRTLPLLSKAALTYADAGADVIAPSDMMDGRVAAIRDSLNAASHAQLAICSYSAKYASSFYGPFRDAADSAPAFGDRRTHQMDPANRREALTEVTVDLAEGADMVMVKPAGPYLDVIRQVRDRVEVPVVAYQVSGEYSMIKAAAANGWVDGTRVMMESLTSIARAGAGITLTYFATDAARLIESTR